MWFNNLFLSNLSSYYLESTGTDINNIITSNSIIQHMSTESEFSSINNNHIVKDKYHYIIIISIIIIFVISNILLTFNKNKQKQKKRKKNMRKIKKSAADSVFTKRRKRSKKIIKKCSKEKKIDSNFDGDEHDDKYYYHKNQNQIKKKKKIIKKNQTNGINEIKVEDSVKTSPSPSSLTIKSSTLLKSTNLSSECQSSDFLMKLSPTSLQKKERKSTVNNSNKINNISSNSDHVFDNWYSQGFDTNTKVQDLSDCDDDDSLVAKVKIIPSITIKKETNERKRKNDQTKNDKKH